MQWFVVYHSVFCTYGYCTVILKEKRRTTLLIKKHETKTLLEKCLHFSCILHECRPPAPMSTLVNSNSALVCSNILQD